SPTTGSAPLEVHFADLSYSTMKNINSWNWDFGDGSSSIEQNPIYTYQNNGAYSITLEIGDDLGNTDIETKNNYIVVGTLPNADFSANPTNGDYPLYVQFTDLSTAGDGSIVSYEWNFGDSTNLSSQQNPIHRYKNGGNFSVSLKITDEYGLISEITKNNYITVNVPQSYVYPNPFKNQVGKITFKFTGEDINYEETTIKIYDVSSRLIKTIDTIIPDGDLYKGEWTIKQDKSEDDVDNGVYYYSVVTGSNIIITDIFAILR
ncbi:MAG: PKD domain-containing protein, partial [Candidatus Cloacimonadota bacterium]|nr:PKD domain-containing protein [Candidatus Cloacimonadota bacterium]